MRNAQHLLYSATTRNSTIKIDFQQKNRYTWKKKLKKTNKATSSICVQTARNTNQWFIIYIQNHTDRLASKKQISLFLIDDSQRGQRWTNSLNRHVCVCVLFVLCLLSTSGIAMYRVFFFATTVNRQSPKCRTFTLYTNNIQRSSKWIKNHTIKCDTVKTIAFGNIIAHNCIPYVVHRVDRALHICFLGKPTNLGCVSNV